MQIIQTQQLGEGIHIGIQALHIDTHPPIHLYCFFEQQALKQVKTFMP